MIIKKFLYICDQRYLLNLINTHTPVAQKVADEVVFRRFQGEIVDFFKSDFTNPPQIFDADLLKNTNLSPSSFHFSVCFYIKIML